MNNFHFILCFREGIEKIVFEEVKYEDIIIPLERIAFMVVFIYSEKNYFLNFFFHHLEIGG